MKEREDGITRILSKSFEARDRIKSENSWCCGVELEKQINQDQRAGSN